MIPDIKPVVQKDYYCYFVFEDDLSKYVADIHQLKSPPFTKQQKKSPETISQHKQYVHMILFKLSDNEAESLPPTLKSLLHMLMDGSGIDSCITEVQGYNINWATHHFNSFTMETRVRS